MRLRVRNAQVSCVKTESVHLCDNKYRMCVYKAGSITILENETEPNGQPVSTLQNSLNEHQCNQSFETPVANRKQKKGIKKTCDKLEKKLHTSDGCKQRISEITGNQKKCGSFDLRVKSVVTAGLATSPYGKGYLTFIGADESGEIACTIFEPHSLTMGCHIQVIFLVTTGFRLFNQLT